MTLDGRAIFESGAVDAQGRLAGVENEHRLPHVRTVERPEHVVVYEMVAADPDGAPTTLLTKMVRRLKDNRLLPRGWKSDGPHVADTAPVGTDGDEDFVGGGDTVSFRVPLPAAAAGRLVVAAELLYQAVPPLSTHSCRVGANTKVRASNNSRVGLIYMASTARKSGR